MEPNLIGHLFERVFAIVALALVNRVIAGADGLPDLKGFNPRIGKRYRVSRADADISAFMASGGVSDDPLL